MSEYNNDTVNAEDRPGFVDYKALPFVKAKVKFYNAERGFGFVTLLDEDGQPSGRDAFLPGTKLEQAGYEEIIPGQDIQVKHTTRPKGEAVVLVKHPPGFTSNTVDTTPVKIIKSRSDSHRNRRLVEESEEDKNKIEDSHDHVSDATDHESAAA